MARADKLLVAMRRNPRADWTIEDVRSICAANGITCIAPRRGDHFKLAHPSQVEIVTVPAHRPIKQVYIRIKVDLVDAVRKAGA